MKFQRSHVSIFLSYYKPHLHLFLLDMACALGIALIDLAFPYLSRLSMQELLPQNLFGAFFGVMGCLLAAYLLRAGMYYIVTYLGHMMGVLIEADIRRDLFGHMQNLSFSFYDKNRTGQLMSRATTDLFEITELAHHGPEDLFISVITLGGAFCLMLTIQWKLALIVFAVVPLFVIFTIFQRRRMMKASVQVKQNMAGINGQLESSISGMRTAKAFANEEQENRKFQQSNNQFKGAKRDYYKAMATYMAGLEFALPAMNVLTITAGGWFILQGEMNYIDLITFALYISTFLTPVRKLAAFVEQFLNGMAGFKRFVELMRVEPAVQDAPDAVDMDTAKGDILVDDVSFSYEDGETVLDHVSIHIPQGETVAVVGPSGGGKSTLCQLIPRFYDVTGGRILVDGMDVRHLTQQSLRQNIGIVQQDVFLFAGTIYDNIRYGKPDATQEEIMEAAKRAEIYDDIMAMPDGFQTYVGERGVMLSGGQKQRVSIARIFLKNPPILILDEATSALDSVTEARIQSAFDELAKGRTTLIIAHRLSTIRNAHRIIVVDDNRIVEEGTHQELLQSGGEYAQLYNAQKSVSV
ncbi:MULTISPECIES: ABC transporter ATP-binding protein [unclassified Pseudoflavonifractor]|uniref:ABC transporter ATP-binding protein n=1 Tax=unclassified Pseudoflavonifractor TaxID=2628103 RepID=UPI000B36820E|nr:MULTISPECIES: ABC transporter ATP-binding protein [unclassified Pseudoflavonifractor]OUN98747.1 thiamine ABC transporter permease [Pseudoflavonifractor sp. An44]OUP44837.1 thiamine ABC transporter permease [Pseudoflavonifractor sp. An187]OUP63699.1 thiamine ABC transporter permease [Pseudoflavonifractor sp. An176]